MTLEVRMYAVTVAANGRGSNLGGAGPLALEGEAETDSDSSNSEAETEPLERTGTGPSMRRLLIMTALVLKLIHEFVSDSRSMAQAASRRRVALTGSEYRRAPRWG
jgi:hypothetical protein